MSSTEKEIFNCLLNYGCCKLCSVRYLCNKSVDFADVDSYLTKNDFEVDLADQDGNEGVTKRPKKNPCPTCLGLLEDASLDSIIESLDTSEVKSYDTTVFTCSISMPPAVLLREHSIRLYLEEKFPNFFIDDNNEIPLNRAWKMFVKKRLSEYLSKTFENSDVCNFSINICTDYKMDKQELLSLKKMQPKIFKDRTTQHRKYNGELFSRKGVLDALSKTSPVLFKIYYPVPPEIPSDSLTCKKIECRHNSIYIAGRYCKFSRELSQSPWIIDGVKTMETSIQEIIFEQICQLFGIVDNNLKFASSGREDCDVRCLGKGRPFYIEISNPKKTIFTFNEFRTLEKLINTSTMIQVRDLQIVERSELIKIKEGEESKTKDYNALCLTKEPVTQEMMDKINECGSIEIRQKTPIRVLHRRPLAVRTRMIHKISAKSVADEPKLINLHLTTQAGTYVKEFVHGDFGRTIPNLGEVISCEVDIIALDVLAINLDWPKEINCDDNC